MNASIKSLFRDISPAEALAAADVAGISADQFALFCEELVNQRKIEKPTQKAVTKSKQQSTAKPAKGTIILEGELQKQGKINTQWSTRRVVLTKGRLWYKHRWGFNGKSVDLSNIRVSMTKADGKGPFSFKIHTEAGQGEEFEFRISTRAALHSWVQAISEAAIKSDSSAGASEDKEVVAAAAAVSLPLWQERKASCQICGNKFGIMTPRHHCRFCGLCCCDSCSQHRRPIFPGSKKERCCTRCEELAQVKKRDGTEEAAQRSTMESKSSTTPPTGEETSKPSGGNMVLASIHSPYFKLGVRSLPRKANCKAITIATLRNDDKVLVTGQANATDDPSMQFIQIRPLPPRWRSGFVRREYLRLVPKRKKMQSRPPPPPEPNDPVPLDALAKMKAQRTAAKERQIALKRQSSRLQWPGASWTYHEEEDQQQNRDNSSSSSSSSSGSGSSSSDSDRISGGERSDSDTVPQTPRTPGGTDDIEALKAQMAQCEANEQFTQAVAIKDKIDKLEAERARATALRANNSVHALQSLAETNFAVPDDGGTGLDDFLASSNSSDDDDEAEDAMPDAPVTAPPKRLTVSSSSDDDDEPAVDPLQNARTLNPSLNPNNMVSALMTPRRSMLQMCPSPPQTDLAPDPTADKALDNFLGNSSDSTDSDPISAPAPVSQDRLPIGRKSIGARGSNAASFDLDDASFLDSDTDDESARTNPMGLSKAEDGRDHDESVALSEAAAAAIAEAQRAIADETKKKKKHGKKKKKKKKHKHKERAV